MRITLLKTLLLAFLLAPGLVQAQKTLRQKMADEFCKELDKQDISDTWNEENQQKMGLAMIPVITKYSKEIKSELGIDLSSQDDYKKIGEIIGAEAGLSCPKFRKMMEKLVTTEAAPADLAMEGTLVELDLTGSFAFFKVKDASGREQKIWWMEYFDGSEDLAKNLTTLRKKQVSITYTEREVYEPKLKDYIKIKVATSFAVVN